MVVFDEDFKLSRGFLIHHKTADFVIGRAFLPTTTLQPSLRAVMKSRRTQSPCYGERQYTNPFRQPLPSLRVISEAISE